MNRKPNFAGIFVALLLLAIAFINAIPQPVPDPRPVGYLVTYGKVGGETALTWHTAKPPTIAPMSFRFREEGGQEYVVWTAAGSFVSWKRMETGK